MYINVRPLKKEDIYACIKLFQETIHSINAKDYSPEQLAVWAPCTISADDSRWRSLLDNIAVVAEGNGQLVGFADITKTGYLDRLFVYKSYQRKGIATVLLAELEKQAYQLGVRDITTEASITAKPFFLARGYQVCKEQQKDFKEVIFINYVMQKLL